MTYPEPEIKQSDVLQALIGGIVIGLMIAGLVYLGMMTSKNKALKNLCLQESGKAKIFVEKCSKYEEKDRCEYNALRKVCNKNEL